MRRLARALLQYARAFATKHAQTGRFRAGGRTVGHVSRIVLSLLLLLVVAPAAHAGSWRRPVDGPVVRSFVVVGDRYARGQHRGVDLGAPPGSVVRSACSGRVDFTGRVPGGGLTISVRCGPVVATYQQLGALAVRAGEVVARGRRLGAVGRSGDAYTRQPHLHFGAREAATGRYLDPLTLLGADTPAAPVIGPVNISTHSSFPFTWVSRHPL